MPSVCIAVDTNAAETALYEAVVSLASVHTSVSVWRERLDVGDVRIAIEGDDPQTILVERKRWSDLAASICDGRYREQKSRFMEGRSPHERLAYVVESPTMASWEGKTRGMLNKACYAALIKTQFRDAIAVLHTSDTTHTAHAIVYLAIQTVNGGLQASSSSVDRSKISVGSKRRKRDSLSDGFRCAAEMVSVVPGMSVSKATALLEQFGSLQDLVKADEKTIADVKCDGKRRLGEVTAKRIIATFSSSRAS